MAALSSSSSSFSMEQLICAMAPTEHVLHAFRQECCCSGEEQHKEKNTVAVWYTEESQQRFAQIIQYHWSDDVVNTTTTTTTTDTTNTTSHSGPSSRYLARLVKRYVTCLETENHTNDDDNDGGGGGGSEVQNDDLMELIWKCSMMKDLNLPDAHECCHVSYQIPSFLHTPHKHKNNTTSFFEDHTVAATPSKLLPRQPPPPPLLRLQVYPHHNDVGVRKVWEAGACLAEFLLQNPRYVSHKSIVELGAGVGLTGLVVAGCCQATQVHMTDYTTPCMENLQHNININAEWFAWQQQQQQQQQQHDNTVPQVSPTTRTTCGYLEWDSYANDDHDNDADTMMGKKAPPPTENTSCSSSTTTSISSQATSVLKLAEADVLLAGDVAYDVSVLPSLGKLVRKFLYTEKAPPPTTPTTGGGGNNGQSQQFSKTTTPKALQTQQKLAIFATTLRNKQTFAALETALLENRIQCTYVDSKELNLLPEIFPSYLLVQPRTDIRICLMTALRT